MFKKIFPILALAAMAYSCSAKDKTATQKEARQFIEAYTKEYVRLYTNSQNAQWQSNIEIKQNDSTNTIAARRADEAMAAFTGSKENIAQARLYMKSAASLTPLQKKQVEFILYTAANNPQTIAPLIKSVLRQRTGRHRICMASSICWVAKRYR